MEIVSSIAVKIAECTIAPIGQWLCYSFHYKSNIENLKKEEKNLQDVKNRVQHSVEAALINNYNEEIEDEVNTWLKKVGDIIELATKKLCESEQEAGTRSSNVACLNLKHRHRLSREAKKIVEDINQLVKNGNFDKVCYLPASKGMDYNIENLKNQEENLRGFKNRLQHSVEAALRNGDEIEDDVKKWFTKADCITELATTKLCEIEEEARTRSSNAACLNLKHRYQLSQEAKKMADDIAELVKNGNFDRVSYRPASKGMEMMRNMDYMTMKSRMTAVKEIMEALGNADINKIGVWGMPGVGKSTLMKEIARQASEEKLFNEVVMTVVTNSPSVKRIQEEIADMLGLKFDEKSETGRARRLERRISKDKKVLVILDDIWKGFDIHDIGIPSEGCKVVMTSRDHDVLIDGMCTQKAMFELKILLKEEAWNLFEKNMGESVSNPNLRGTATEIAEKCAGLPIALVTVSRALKDKSLAIWKDALVQLKRATHDTRIDGKILAPVYSCIELSYEHLVGEEVQSLFLLCARQGYYISNQDLLRYGFGLGLFGGIETLEEARNRLERLVRNLQDSCLLLESPHSFNKFYMHDLVRDVATIIASKNHNMFIMRDDGGQKAWPDVEALNRCEALSIHGGDIHKHPNKMECPKLRFFNVDCQDSCNLKIPDIFFQGMEKLEVLSLRNMQLLSLFPLTNLQTLCLDRCKLGDIHGIGELKTLVILSLAHSDISNLPREIGSLTRLRLLDLSHCFRLEGIPPNVLSSLVNLEELYMRGIDVQWEVEGPSNEGKNASLAELKKLSQLTTLEIDIRNANNLPANLFHEKLERYKISIGDMWHSFFMGETAFSKVLKLKPIKSFQLDSGFKMLLKRTEYLSLDEANSTKSVLYELHREDFQQLKHLHIQNNGNIKHILVLRTSDVAFPILETFVLKDMFKNLKVLKVENCEKLRFIFSSSIAKGLSLLEELNITRCNNMGAIFVKEEEDGIEDQGDMMSFGRLQTLVLNCLPKLVSFLSTKDSFMADCRETNSEGNHDLQLPLLHQVSLPSLQTLRMEGLPKIKRVWSCGQEPKIVFTGLLQLKILEISNCGVEEIVAVEGGGEAVAIRTLVFPRVSTLTFRNLKRLKWFYKRVHVSKWPMLKEMEIEGCEEFEIFASGVVSFEETVEERQSEMSIKQSLFLVDELSFTSLETLHISNMDSLEIKFGKLEGQNRKESQVLISPRSGTEESGATTHFVSTGKLPLIYFKNLKVLKVENCQKLRFVFSSSIARGLSLLEKLEIKRCSNMGAIVVREEKDGIEDGDVILFHQLQTLVLEDLPELVSFLSTKSSFMTDCGQIIAEGNHNLHMPLLHQQGKLPLIYFKNLKVLEVENCQKLRFVFSSSIARGLPLLEKLKIKRCNNMGAIVVREEKDEIEDGDVILFHQLQTLVLEDLPELVSFLSTKSSFMTDCGQIIAEGNHNLHMPLLHQQVSFPSLQTLHMEGLLKIKHVWSYDQEPKTDFRLQNLQKIYALRCESLKSLFPISVIRCLEQLQVLKIEDCGVEELVAIERGGGEAIERTLVFPQVTELNLINLKRLKWFYKGVHVTKWPMLEEMKIERCEKVEIFASRIVSFQNTVQDQRQSEMSIKQPLFSVDEHSFPSLQTLLISNMDSLEIIFGKLEGQNGKEPQVLISPASRTEESGATTHFVSTGKLPLIYFKNLKVLEVENCQKLRFVSSSSIARGLSLLEKLKIKRCNNMGAIVMTEGKDGIEDGDVILFHQLQTLVLENLPELVSFLSTESSFMTDCGQIIAEGNHNLHMPLLHQQVSFLSLQKLRMEGLLKIKQVWSCGQEPKTVFTGLEQLKKLEISNCGVEEIVAFEGGGEAIAIRTFVFSRVTKLNLINLKKLKWFYKGVHVSKWPMLKEMKIEGCKKVKIFASEVVSFQETVKDQRPSEMSNIKQPLFSVDELSFPSLKTLHIGQMDKLEIIGQDQVAASFFSNIQELRISYCAKLLHVFPTSILMKSLTTLQKLTIVSCGVEEIVAVEGRGGEAAARTLVFPRVTDLTLQSLWRLKWFYKGVHISKWPMLENMSIEGCEKVEIFASGVVSFEEMQSEMSIKQPLFLVDELSFPSLKTLHIRWMYKLEIIGQDQVAATSFSNIQKLKIVECAKLLHVFQSNLHTTTTLIQSLTSLHIEDCDSLETIFRNMEGQNGKESQVLIAPSSGLEESIAREDGTTRHIEFPTLTEISLLGLPKLKWIFEGVHTNLECPSLKILQLGAFGQVINMNWASKFPRSSSSQENQLQTCNQQPIFVFDEATFPNLEMLSLDYCGKTKCPSSFPSLVMFSLDYGGKTKCPSRYSDFPAGPSCPIIRLPTLLELKVCSSGWEEISSCDLVDREIRLRKLSLNHLPMLIHLWKEDNTQPCPLFHNLEFLGLSRCSKLKNLGPSSVSLHNLIDLNISSCHGLTNLLTSSTAKTLVRIRSMTVTNCKRITEIVAMEDGEANVAITFNNLTFLELNGLPNLTNFCPGPYFFGFPYLREVTVRCCPEMKTFSHGVLSTPKLTAVYDDYRWGLKRNSHWEDDLNTTTRRLWESNQYDTQWLFKERVENSEEDENHPSEDEDHFENSEEDEDEDHSENSEEG